MTIGKNHDPNRIKNKKEWEAAHYQKWLNEYRNCYRIYWVSEPVPYTYSVETLDITV